jgi:hypothetical protein
VKGNAVGTRGQAQARLATAATNEATRRLREVYAREVYAVEYAALLREERVSRGLSEEPTSSQIARLRERVWELEQELMDKVGPA